MKVALLSTILVAIVSLHVWGYWYRSQGPHSLAAYGVVESSSTGDSPSQVSIQFYRYINGKRFEGPEVTGSYIESNYKDLDQDGIPEIIIQAPNPGRRTILKLNLTDPKRPEFEILENSLTLHYPPLGYRWL